MTATRSAKVDANSGKDMFNVSFSRARPIKTGGYWYFFRALTEITPSISWELVEFTMTEEFKTQPFIWDKNSFWMLCVADVRRWSGHASVPQGIWPWTLLALITEKLPVRAQALWWSGLLSLLYLNCWSSTRSWRILNGNSLTVILFGSKVSSCLQKLET